jgi:glutamate synthase (ferredoxin)
VSRLTRPLPFGRLRLETRGTTETSRPRSRRFRAASTQYIVTDNDEERPFSRDQRRWIYASAKRENNYFGFGSDNEMELQPSYLIIKHDTFPLGARHPGDPGFVPQFRVPCAKVMGVARGRARAFRPASIVNVSGMSFGSLTGPDRLELLDDRVGSTTVAELFGYGRGFGVPSPTDCEEVRRLMNA